MVYNSSIKNVRPVSNLQLVSKLTEKAVATQKQCHTVDNDLLTCLQSAYWQNHNTETAFLWRTIYSWTSKGHLTLLVLLDLSVAFDMVDHGILLRMLQSLFGLRGRALSWFQSYLQGRAQHISGNGTLSNRFALECGVQQGSHLGLLIFAIYTSEVFEILCSHLPSAHVYADDTQLYMSFRPSDGLNALEAVTALENCILHVRVLRWEGIRCGQRMKGRSFYWLAVVYNWLRCLSTASRLVKLMYLLPRPQGTWVLGSTPTWICLLLYPKLAVAHSTISTSFVISGSSSQGGIFNGWFMPSSQVN